jgi:hypothetical protein
MHVATSIDDVRAQQPQENLEESLNTRSNSDLASNSKKLYQ